MPKNVFSLTRPQTQAIVDGILAQHPEFKAVKRLVIKTLKLEAEVTAEAPFIGDVDVDLIAEMDEGTP